MRSDIRAGVRALVAALAVALVAASASGQTGQAGQSAQQPGQATPVAAPAQPAPQPSALPVRQLSITEAVTLALEQNLGIQVERLNPELQEIGISQAETAWIPTVFGGVTRRTQDSPPSSFLSGGEDKISDSSTGGNFGVTQILPWGTAYTVSFDSSRATTTNQFTSFNPVTRGNLDATVEQPFLRNFLIDRERTNLLVARMNKQISDINLQQTLALTERTVRSAYWEYKYALASLEVARQSLELAQESLRNTRSRVEIGTLAPIDVVEAESEVARREEAVILAEAAIGQTEDQLKSLIFDPSKNDLWGVNLEPVDPVPFQLQSVDVNAAVTRALGERTDLRQSKKSLERTRVEERFFKNQTLPDLNFRLDYNSTGIGGTQLVRGEGAFPPPVIGEIDKPYGDVLNDVFSNEFPTWVLSVNIAYPIGQSAADASLARTRLEARQTEINQRNLELLIATEVRDAARQLMSNAKRVEATRAARVLAERRLEAEEKKFAAGMSTSFLVFQAQRDLAQARATELRATLDYTNSQVDFETVQVAPLGGGRGLTTASAVGTALGTSTAVGAAVATGAGGGGGQ